MLFYGRVKFAPTKVDGKLLTVTMRSQQRPIGSDLLEESHMGGGYIDHSKGDPVGVELAVWQASGVDDDVTNFEVESQDTNPSERCRIIGKAALQRVGWRRHEVQGKGEVVKWSMTVTAFDNPELLALVMGNSVAAVSLCFTQYELPNLKPAKVSKRKKKAEQAPLPFNEEKKSEGPTDEEFLGQTEFGE